jgi:putative ABC transport system substrate-binding protein
MKMKKWILSVLTIAVVVLAACGNGEEANGETSGDVINIGTLRQIDHESLTAAEEGFYEALADNGYVEGENLEIQSLSAQGTQANLNPMAQQVTDENDLVLTIGTGAAQAVANADQETPTIFTAVTDPIDAGLVESQEAPGRNLTGTSDQMPVDQQIDLLLSLDEEATAVGVIYDSSEPNSQIQAEEAIQYIEEAGLEAVVTTVTSTNDVQQNLGSIAEDIDLLYVPTDNTIAATMPTVREITIDNQIPSVLGAPEMVEAGGLTTYSIDYTSLGYQAGEMAVQILEGNAEPATMPYENADELILVVNDEVAAELGIDPESIQIPE